MDEISNQSESLIIWSIDDIPDNCFLYVYVHKGNINLKTGEVYPKAFQNTPFIGGKDLSSDWDKYSTPDQTRERIGLQKNGKGLFKNPSDYFILSLRAHLIREQVKSPQELIHDPIQNHLALPDNRAHTKIEGEKDEEARLKFCDIYAWAIPPTTA